MCYLCSKLHIAKYNLIEHLLFKKISLHSLGEIYVPATTVDNHIINNLN
jgi:hypothetical protein